MVGERHAVERRHGFALTARCDEGQFARLVPLDFVDIDQYACGHFHVPQFDGGADDVQHTAPRNRNFALMPRTGIDDLLNAMHVGRERGNNDAFLFVR